MEQLDKGAEPKLKTKLKINIFIFLVFYKKTLYSYIVWVT